MKEMTCIVCPNGCRLRVEQTGDSLEVSGNRCDRGAAFARSEVQHPMRTISSTVKTGFRNVPVVPVRVSAQIPKERIFDVMKEIHKVLVTEPLGNGDAVLTDVLGLGVNVIVTTDILKGEKKL